jgi:N-dimethylarginine dimethylaminohydrolase
VACPEETSSRRYAEVIRDVNGGYRVDLNLSQKFGDHLSDQSLGIFDLSKEEQLHYAPNFLNLGNRKVVLSLIKGNELKGKLEDVGYTVYSPNLEQITKGFGGLHCMTAAIKRG